MLVNERQLSEQLFWRQVNLCEQNWISLSERHHQATSHAVKIFSVEATMGNPTLPLARPQVKPPTRAASASLRKVKKSRPPTGGATGAPRLEMSSRRLAGRIVVGRGGGFRLRIIPRQPGRGPCLHLLGVVRQGQQIGEGIDPIEPAGVDQTHEHVAAPGAVKRLLAESVFAMYDRHFERLLGSGSCAMSSRRKTTSLSRI